MPKRYRADFLSRTLVFLPKQDECGEWVTALCPYGEDGCPDNEGDYDIVMPEPMTGTSGSGYKVRFFVFTTQQIEAKNIFEA